MMNVVAEKREIDERERRKKERDLSQKKDRMVFFSKGALLCPFCHWMPD